MKNRINYILLFVIGIICNVSCVTDNNSSFADERDSDFYLYLNLPEAEVVETRSDQGDNLQKIAKESLHLLVFESSENEGESKCKGTLTAKDIEKKDNQYVVRIEGLKDYRSTKIDLAVVANTQLSIGDNQNLIGQTKQDISKQLVFDVNNENFAEGYLPAWGEIKEITVNENTGTRYGDKLEVTLLRSVASINFKSADKSSTGLAFNLKEVYVYHSFSQGLVIPNNQNLGNDFVVQEPSLPQNPNYNTSTTPLEYEVSESASCIDKIFVPEHDKKTDSKEKPYITFVLGGTIGSDTQTYYYRFNFHKKNNEDTPYELMNVLRNHKYIFTINGVNGLGATYKEAAYESPATNIDVDVVVWDEGITTGYVIVDKYIGLDTSSYTFEKAKVGDELKIDLQTNYNEVTAEINNKDYGVKVSDDKTHLIVTIEKVNTANKNPSTITINGCEFKKSLFQTEAVYDKMNVWVVANEELKKNSHYKLENLEKFITSEHNFGPTGTVKGGGLKIIENKDSWSHLSQINQVKGDEGCDILIFNIDNIISNKGNAAILRYLDPILENIYEFTKDGGVVIYLTGNKTKNDTSIFSNIFTHYYQNKITDFSIETNFFYNSFASSF